MDLAPSSSCKSSLLISSGVDCSWTIEVVWFVEDDGLESLIYIRNLIATDTLRSYSSNLCFNVIPITVIFLNIRSHNFIWNILSCSYYRTTCCLCLVDIKFGEPNISTSVSTCCGRHVKFDLITIILNSIRCSYIQKVMLGINSLKVNTAKFILEYRSSCSISSW